MRRFDDHLLLSPSDLNDLLECRHLMALEIARFRGEPVPERTRGAHTEILVRYGEQHEARVLAELEAEGVPVVRIETGPARAGCARRSSRPVRAMADGAEVIHQAALVADGRRRLRRLPGAGRPPVDAGRLELRGGRRQAGAHHQAVLPRPALGLRGDAGASCRGWRRRSIAVLLGDGSRDTYRTADFAAYVRALHDRAEQAGRRRRRRHLPAALFALRDLRLPPRLRAAARRGRPPVAGRGPRAATRRCKLEEAGVSTLAGAGRAPGIDRGSRGWPATRWPSCGAQAALQLQERVTGEQRYELLALRARRGLRAAARAGRRRPVLRHRGRPLHRGQGARVPVRGGLARRRRRDRVPRVLGATTATRSGARSRR